MKNILAISSSLRPKGNGETLLTLCEKYFSRTDSEFSFEKIFLKDFNISDCLGCLGCVINNEFCKINDDLNNLLDQIMNCDALIISSPVYFLGSTSLIKSLNDRLLYLYKSVDYSKRKPAGIIITAGREGWEGFAVQNVSTLLLSLGFYVKDVIVSHAQGPSEVLLDIDIERKINDFSSKVIDPEYKVPNLSDKCPVCFGDSFKLTGLSTVCCPVCNISGEIVNQNDNKTLILFSESDINNSRWSSENLRDHMENWVAGSGKKYREKVKDVLRLRKELLKF